MAISSGAPAQKYDRMTIALHWLMAVGVAVQWLDAHTIDWFPKGPLRVDMRSVHIIGGWLVLAALCVRIWWRAARGSRLPAPNGDGLYWVARLVHVLLYLLLAGVVGLGLASSLVRSDMIFGWFSLPMIGPADAGARHDLGHWLVDWHAMAANWLLIAAGFHAVAGLAHHYLFRDAILMRMRPG